MNKSEEHPPENSPSEFPDENSSRELISTEESRIQEIARAAVTEQFHTLEALRDQFRQYSQRRRQEFHHPFVLESHHIDHFDKYVRAAISKVHYNAPVSFIGLVRLKDRREVSFFDVESLKNWDEPEKSRPVRVQMNWKYTYSPPGMALPVPLTYDIYIDYETEPDVEDKMRLQIEESVLLHIEGPDIDWVRSANEVLATSVDGTKMPFWWRALRWTLNKFKPFFDNGLFFALMFLAWMSWGVFYGDKRKEEVADKIFALSDMAQKYDAYITHWATPSPVLKFMLFMFFAFMVVGVLYLAVVTTYRYIAPSSVIALGIMGKKKKAQLKVYGALWMLAISGTVGAVISKFI